MKVNGLMINKMEMAMKNGNDKYFRPDNASYTGYYKDGKKNGQGNYKWSDGSEYTGEWADNNLNGIVILIIF